MNKAQIINEIKSTLKEHKASKKLEASVLELLSQFETRGSKSGGSQYPNVVFEGEEYKWCKRHQQYEKLTEFNYNEKKGRHDPECAIAKQIWVQYGKDIGKLERQTSSVLADPKGDLKAHVQKIEDLKALRGGHDYDKTGTEDYVLPEGAETTPVGE